ncbi:MAG: glycosyltransferase family 2 protein [Gammaproteobacteria bacterium]|nr:glycosyltransferase family 2 protein [Gammaproteobacteria bacterium]
MSTVNDLPRLSIVIVNYNGGEMLRHCLDYLERQNERSFEVIVVDNGSADNSVAVCEDPWSFPLRSHLLGWNSGFAYANNRGAELARGEWLALLNSDAFADERWTQGLLAAVDTYAGKWFFTSHQLQFNNPAMVDGTGDIYATNGRAWRRDYGAPVAEASYCDNEVFGACGAAACFLRQAFLDLGGFDERYFCYFEDVDLSLRFRLAGYRCMHIQNALVYHIGSATSGGEVSHFSVFYGYRNLVWTYFKSMPLPLLIKYLPQHLLLNWRQIIGFYRMGQGRIILKSKLAALLGLPRILLIDRRRVQRQRVIDAATLDKALVKDPTAG